MSDRPESQRRGTSRLFELPGEMQCGRSRVQDFRLQGKTGPRQYPQSGCCALYRRIYCCPTGSGGLTPWWWTRQFDFDPGSLHGDIGHLGKADEIRFCRSASCRRSHLLYLESCQNEAALPEVVNQREFEVDLDGNT